MKKRNKRGQISHHLLCPLVLAHWCRQILFFFMVLGTPVKGGQQACLRKDLVNGLEHFRIPQQDPMTDPLKHFVKSPPHSHHFGYRGPNWYKDS